jgi:two-component system response regulator HydG
MVPAVDGRVLPHHAEPATVSLVNRTMGDLEKQAIIENLEVHGGNREKVAQVLGIGERTLYRKLKEYGIK